LRDRIALHTLEVRAQVGPALVAEISGALECFADDPEELGRKISTFIPDHGPVFGEGRAPGRHFVQDDAETPDVAARVDV
jgi:hypothetical protein